MKSIEQALLVERKLQSETDTKNSNTVFIILLSVIGLVLVAVYLVITGNLRMLRRIGQEAADKNWTLTGSGELIKNMQGDKQVGELAETIINHLARWLNAGTGAIYIAEEDDRVLQLVAGYAIDKNGRNSLPFRFGEGLAGQAAAEKRVIRVSDLPPGYLKIHTSCGQVQLANILAAPFVLEGVVRGVIELGNVRVFTERQEEYLENDSRQYRRSGRPFAGPDKIQRAARGNPTTVRRPGSQTTGIKTVE